MSELSNTCPACGVDSPRSPANTASVIAHCPHCHYLWVLSGSAPMVSNAEALADTNLEVDEPEPGHDLVARPKCRRFVKLSGNQGSFTISGKTLGWRARLFPGMVVASRDTLFFALDREAWNNQAPRAHGAVAAGARAGGLVGAIIGGIVAATIEEVMAARRQSQNVKLLCKPLSSISEVDLAELPDEITTHRRWPIPWTTGPVVVVPRESVKSIKTSFWEGNINVRVQGARLIIATPICRRKTIAGKLVRLGWEVKGY